MHDGAVVSLMHRDGDEQSWYCSFLVLWARRPGKHSRFLCFPKISLLLLSM
jgi:hypothetical protein